jgi:hypothetical protein
VFIRGIYCPQKGAWGGLRLLAQNRGTILRLIRESLTDPRRSARMTHFCSLRLTHTKNTFCRRARDGANDIIHAEGVRGDFPSSAPKARNALTSQEEAACVGERLDAGGRQGQPAQHLPCDKKALLPGDKTPPNWPWWWVTFGEQSRVISRECRSTDWAGAAPAGNGLKFEAGLTGRERDAI